MTQVDKFVNSVQFMIQKHGRTIDLAEGIYQDENAQALDLDEVHNTSMKIFGDVFESLIGAVFMDCRDIDETWVILKRLIEPYMKVYANLDTM